MKRNTLATVLIVLGVVALLAALGLLLLNLRSEANAGEQSLAVLQELRPSYDETPDIPAESSREPENSEQAPQNFPQEPELPVIEPDPERELPEKEVDGRAYVGVITIPSLELELPILSQWSMDGVRVAPCRLEGTPYKDNLVLGAHNYTVHFGKLSLLKTGDSVYFEDLDGNVFSYEVVSFELLKPNQGEVLCDGQWDLTLFTCTLSGRSRFTVRCQRTS